MFKTLKSLKERYENSSSWGEFFASYLIDLDSIYKRLEGKTKDQQIEILKRALEEQTKKTKELVGEIARQNEMIEQLNKELGESWNNSAELGKLEESERELEAKITQFEIITRIKK